MNPRQVVGAKLGLSRAQDKLSQRNKTHVVLLEIDHEEKLGINLLWLFAQGGEDEFRTVLPNTNQSSVNRKIQISSL